MSARAEVGVQPGKKGRQRIGAGLARSRRPAATRYWLRSKLATSRVALRKKHDDAQRSESESADDESPPRDYHLPLHAAMRADGGLGGLGGTRAAAALDRADEYGGGVGGGPSAGPGPRPSIFRSEPVLLVQLYLQSEVAHAALEELGEAGARGARRGAGRAGRLVPRVARACVCAALWRARPPAERGLLLPPPAHPHRAAGTLELRDLNQGATASQRPYVQQVPPLF